MTIKSIANLNLYKIVDKTTNQTYTGCQQLWYPKKWQRLAGCGPTVATNLFFYLSHNRAPLELVEGYNTKENWISLMEELWKYVTPSMRGVNTTQMFYKPLLSFMKSKGFNADYRFCDIADFKNSLWRVVIGFIHGIPHYFDCLLYSNGLCFKHCCTRGCTQWNFGWLN